MRLLPLGDVYTLKLSREQLATAVQKGLVTLIGSPGFPPEKAEPFIPPGQGFRGSIYRLEEPQSWGEPQAVLRPIRPFNLVYKPEISQFFEWDWRKLTRPRMVSIGGPLERSKEFHEYRAGLERQFMAAITGPDSPDLNEADLLRAELEILR